MVIGGDGWNVPMQLMGGRRLGPNLSGRASALCQSHRGTHGGSLEMVADFCFGSDQLNSVESVEIWIKKLLQLAQLTFPQLEPDVCDMSSMEDL